MYKRPTRTFAYTVFGYCRDLRPSQLSFNGQREDPRTGCYPLGNGYRHYSPVLMRFLSADRLSPFKQGGVNGYAYCANDPVNHVDPSGFMKTTLKRQRPTPQKTDPNPSIPARGKRVKQNLEALVGLNPADPQEWSWNIPDGLENSHFDAWVHDLHARVLHANNSTQTWNWSLDTEPQPVTRKDNWTRRILSETQHRQLKYQPTIDAAHGNMPDDLDTGAISLSTFSSNVRMGRSGNVFSLRVGLIPRSF